MVVDPRGSVVPLRRSSGEDAALYIRHLIFEGELRPGGRVPQDEIAEALGISRIPVREALVALEREGWVTIEMHRGAFVNALTEQTVDDHFELLGTIYRFAIDRAVSRTGAAFVSEAAKAYAAVRDASDDAEAGRRIERFLSTIVDATQSPRLRILLRSWSTLVPGDFFAAVPSALDIERRALGGVVRALRKGDAERAGEEFAQMLRRVGREVVAMFRERGLFQSPEAV